jgi:CshA-type fibril repeat protein
MKFSKIFLLLIVVVIGTYATGSTVEKITLGDFVWFDANKNGKQESGESGLEGIQVELYNLDNKELNQTTVTNKNGKYSFNDVLYGGYYLKFIIKDGFKFTQQNREGVDEEFDSDANPLTGETNPLTPFIGENNYIDAGMYPLSKPAINVNKVTNNGDVSNITVGDVVTWKYTIQNSGNMALLNIVVTDDKEGNITECSGDGSFSLLNPTQTLTCTKSGVAVLGNYSNSVTVTAKDEQNNSVSNTANSSYVGKAKVVKTGSIGDYIWLDSNRDGIQDSTELPLSNIRVKLLNSDNQEIQETQSDDVGKYLFSDVVQGSYYITFFIPSGYKVTIKNQGDLTKDSNVNKGGKTDKFDLDEGENLESIDMGIFPSLVLVGNRVWFDTNRDGIQDNSEQEGIKDVSVKLYTYDNRLVANTKTSTSGFYEFKGITAGSYYILFDLPTNYTISPQNIGTNESTDSDANPETKKTELFNLVAGLDNRTVDMGLYHSKAKVGDRVWYDSNKNGLQDSGENGLANVTVKLYKVGKDDAVAETKTTATGIYLFEDIEPSEYYIIFTPPVAYTITQQHRGKNKSLDSDANQNGKSNNFVVEHGTQNSTIDMGVYQSEATIGDRVWHDTNHNGLQERGEVGVKDVKVVLSSATDGEFSKESLTDENGNYLFTHIPAGEYSLEFKDLPYGYLITQKDANNNSNNAVDSDVFVSDNQKVITEVTLLKAGENDLSWDMGIYKTVSLPGKAVLGNLVWEDYNKDGIQDIGERGIANVAVTLFNYDTDEKIATIPTDENGLYEFVHLDPELSYYIQFAIPSGYVVSPKNQDDDIIDSDVDESGKSEVITLEAEQINSSVDMGIHHKGSAIGDRVWYDENQGVSNGIQEENENGVLDVVVTLYGDKREKIAQTQTNASGAYYFTNIPKGKYHIVFSNLPSGYIFTQSQQGENKTLDSDVNSNGETEIFRVDGVHNITDIDAGIKSLNRGESLNDIKRGTTGHSVEIDVLANDIEGSYSFDTSTLRITSTPDGSILTEDGKQLTVPHEGVWQVEDATGRIIFTPNQRFIGDPTPISYTINDRGGNESGAEVEVNYPPVANNDRVNAQIGKEVTIYVTDNDTNTSSPLDKPSVRIIDPSNSDEVESLTVDGEGRWITNNDGSISFTPNEGLESSPRVIEYTVKEQEGDVSNRATVTIIYPDAVDDVVTIPAQHHGDILIDVAQNDSNNTVARTVTIGCGGVGVLQLTVKGEGVWSLNEEGFITFTPEDGFKSEPTDIQYTIELFSGERSNCAVVDIRYELLAVDDTSILNAGFVSLVNILNNDFGSLNHQSVRLIIPENFPPETTLSNNAKTLTVPAQGVWSVNDQGIVSFRVEGGLTSAPTPIYYTVENSEGIQSNQATITLTEGGMALIANDDIASGNGQRSVTINVLENDSGEINSSSVQLIALDGSYVLTLEVDSEGTWRVNEDGSVTFTGFTGYIGTPTPIQYTVFNNDGERSNPATITIRGQCVCKPYEESIPAMGKIAVLLMVLFTLLWGSFLLNKEENLEKNRLLTKLSGNDDFSLTESSNSKFFKNSKYNSKEKK